ncbi:MAG: S-layer family protein [Rhizonema sp. PD38]|nr:S-layer family protein [Rhizonema sp. PD38]
MLSDTGGTGTGASLNVNGSNLIQLSGTGSSLLTQAESTATGSAGDVKINTSELRIQDGSQVSSDTLGAGKGGNFSVNVAKSVQLNGANSRLLAQTESKGDAGDVNINTPTLQVQNGAQVLSNTLGAGRAGSVDINATTMVELSGRSTDGQFASGLFAQTERSATGEAGNLRIITPSLLVENGAQVSAGTLGAGRAGSIDINASTMVQLSGRSADGQFASGLFAQTERNATGEAGNLSITTPTLLVENGAQVSAGTLGIRRGGSINVNATKLVQLTGLSSGLFAQTDAPDATVDAGNLSITTPTLLVENGAQVSVNNTGTGRAGNISITTGSGRLNNGTITARTSSGNGGNLMLDITGNLLLLRNGSQISTTAGTAQRGGNGGNIMINAPNGLIVATPNENSDITANAFSGTGGRIIINSLDIFGIQQRNREDLMLLLRTNDPDQLNPQNSPTNDITAFSQTAPTLNGQIAISTPNVDPSRGLVQLPTVAVNIPELITSSCAAFTNGGSQFTSTGRGGLPPSPIEPLTNDVVWTDTRLPVTTMQQHSSKKLSAKTRLKSKEPVAIVPATGWVFNGKGEVTLISSAPNANGLGFTPATCPMQR